MLTTIRYFNGVHDSAKSLSDLADQCVRCGLCSAVCPTYALDGIEPESPRGRILAMQALSGQSRPDPDLLEARDHCLACLQCQRRCPSRVDYHRLLTLSRQQHPPRQSARERLLLMATRHPALLRLTTLTVPLLRPWLLRYGFPSADPCPAPNNQLAKPGGRVGLFLGCVARWADARTLADARWLIHRAGYGVDLLPGQGCCGTLHRHAGAAGMAERLVQRNRKACRRVDTVLVTASGCLGGLKQALEPETRVVDAVQWLMDRLPPPPLTEHRRLLLHLPCSLRDHEDARAALQRWVTAACNRPVTVIDRGCCGAGGAHLLRFPQRAVALRQPLIQQIQGHDLVLSANVGCALHLRAGLRAEGWTVPVLHPLSWLRTLYEENPTCPV